MSHGQETIQQGFAPEERGLLLSLARGSLAARAEGGNFDPDRLEVPDSLKQPCGCFVTLFRHGELRGCIGHVLPQMPLYKAVTNNACAAGFHDTRFKPVSPDELNDIEIEISVLSELHIVDAMNPEAILAALSPGVDGLLLRKGSQMATFLPQVWEMLPDKREFLSRLCLKAGWDADAWKDGRLDVSTYQVISFSNHSM